MTLSTLQHHLLTLCQKLKLLPGNLVPLPHREHGISIEKQLDEYRELIEEIEKQPVVVHAVQHMFHPPAKIDAWPSDDRRSRLVFIVKDIGRDKIEDALNSYLAMDF